MTDKLQAAAQAALEALERARAYVYETDRPQTDAAMDALRAALAEPTCKQDLQVAEQDAEPFIWYADDTGDTWTPDAVVEGWAPTDLRPLYTAPPRREWQGLTDDEIDQQFKREAWVSATFVDGTQGIALDAVTVRDFARAIEAELKEKNT